MIRIRFHTFILFFFFFLIFPHPPLFCCEKKTIDTDGVVAEFDAHVSVFIKGQKAPGVAIAIVVEGQIVFMKGYGVTKIGGTDRIDIHTAFRIASLSKSFAAVLTGLLVEDGLIGWDDKVTTYLPRILLTDRSNTENLTIRHILSHTSGLLPHAYDNLIEAKVPFEKIIGELKNVAIICPVGKCYAYQNVVYSLISPIIESATKQNYLKLLKNRIVLPLGMTDVSFSRHELVATSNYAHPHIKRDGEWTPTVVKDTYYSVQPAAGINASIHDMAQWLTALVSNGPTIISPEIMNEICEPLITTKTELKRFNWRDRLRSASYGMGWRIFNYEGHTMVFHSGGLRGYLSALAFLPEYKTGIVVLQNACFDNHLIYDFIDIYLKLNDKNNHRDGPVAGSGLKPPGRPEP